MKSGRVLHGRIDWWTVAVALALMAAGWLNLYAAVWEPGAETFSISTGYGRQLLWMAVSAVMAVVVMLVDDKYYHMLAYPIYVVALALMAATIFVGTSVNGARAWLVLGPMRVQPTEFMKFAVALALARAMSVYGFSLRRPSHLFRVGLLVALPVAVMFLQHDVGSAVVYGSFLFMLYREGLNRWVYVVLGTVLTLFFGSFWVTDTGMLMLILAGCAAGFGLMYGNLRAPVIYLAAVGLTSIAVWRGVALMGVDGWRYYHALLTTAAVSLPVVGLLAWGRRLRGFWILMVLFVSSVAFVSSVDVVFDHLDLHQQKRILNTLGIESDNRGWGYNVNQSKIAIGSGGLLGKGYLEGTQTKFNFVPEQSTDFIFCTVGEEWGFAGSIAVLVLFCVLILRLVSMGERCGEPFGRIYCYSVAGIFLLHVLINVGMTIGVVPVIGIPLPFFSYGGSSFLAFTLLLVVALRLDLGSGDIDRVG
ncbi:MAG: rod shape-determining protein RodA [Alistipes sp.]|jgi:rod shape determining protein RodA|nr:rod shape-determining protein RodA [Alistipes sp.]